MMRLPRVLKIVSEGNSRRASLLPFLLLKHGSGKLSGGITGEFFDKSNRWGNFTASHFPLERQKSGTKPPVTRRGVTNVKQFFSFVKNLTGGFVERIKFQEENDGECAKRGNFRSSRFSFLAS